MVLVGGSPPQVEAMKQRAAAAGLGGRCVFTGQVSKTAARELLATADVLVSPRREGTNTPLKVYEQLASGKPLVATNIYSHTQVLTDDVCFLVDPTPQGMADGLARALDEPGEAARRVAGARHLYETAYSRQAYEQKMRDLLAVLGVETAATAVAGVAGSAGVTSAEAR
jgi:glycosyltransferase involved in cell wall biosynthesis